MGKPPHRASSEAHGGYGASKRPRGPRAVPTHHRPGTAVWTCRRTVKTAACLLGHERGDKRAPPSRASGPVRRRIARGEGLRLLARLPRAALRARRSDPAASQPVAPPPLAFGLWPPLAERASSVASVITSPMLPLVEAPSRTIGTSRPWAGGARRCPASHGVRPAAGRSTPAPDRQPGARVGSRGGSGAGAGPAALRQTQPHPASRRRMCA